MDVGGSDDDDDDIFMRQTKVCFEKEGNSYGV